MKKAITFITALSMLLCLVCTSVSAADSAKVYVTIANGTLELPGAEVEVTDVDGDGALTINDALVIAHDIGFEGGSAAGYTSYTGDYGLAISKLWGVENGGSYGYYINNASAMSLGDAVKDGDRINAFVYSDTAAFSDVYCYFDVNSAYTAAGQSVTLTLFAAAYDENWNPVVKPVAGAVITVDGAKSDFVTDENGKVTVTLDKAGAYTLSATSDSAILVPPYCALSVGVAAPQTGDVISVCAAALAFAAVSLLAIRRKNDEK